MIVNVHEAKTHLSRLLRRVEGGEEIVIAKGGRPVAKLVPLRATKGDRTPGTAEGRVWISDDFDAPLPEIERFLE
jgi:prevent-host-death family protein